MRRHRTLLPSLLSLALLVPTAARAAADDDKTYDIRLERPFKVGDRHKVAALGAFRNKLVFRREGEEPRTVDEAAGLRLDGVAEVKEVNKDGRRTRVTVTVGTCTLMVGDKSKSLLPEGKVIEVRWDKDGAETKYAVDGKDVPADMGELLDLALELGDPEGVTDDVIFRTDGKWKVGDTWAADPAAAAREFDRLKLTVKPDDVTGQTTLVEAGKVDGRDVLKLKFAFKIGELSGPGRRPDAKLKLRKGTFAVESSATVPVDPAGQAVREEAKINTTGEMEGTSDDGKKIGVSRTTERMFERTMTEAKAGK